MKHFELRVEPTVDEVYMIAGWQQLANAGDVSFGLPHYLIKKLNAQKIGHIGSDPYYIFQTPVSNLIFRPNMKFEKGYCVDVSTHKNEFYYYEDKERGYGLVIFVGEEPQMRAGQYAEAFYGAIAQLRVKRVLTLSGIHAIVPFDKHRKILALYSLPHMRAIVEDYNMEPFDYNGPATIGAYLCEGAKRMNLEYLGMYVLVPSYDLGQIARKQEAANVTPIILLEDYQAWYDVMVRVNHMFRIGLELIDLAQKGNEGMKAMREDLERLSQYLPINDFLKEVTKDFVEMPFTQLGSVWEDAINDILSEEGG
jgi:proteasome assembly chaperone (PAC2) family protein